MATEMTKANMSKRHFRRQEARKRRFLRIAEITVALSVALIIVSDFLPAWREILAASSVAFLALSTLFGYLDYRRQRGQTR